ncbi:LLM class flavin-dependent oxidoreductase [Streptomyces sp. NPDC048291]|uniref:LLM class flavin-dependent oxidoreductase n=1 Tax=Streptomyces sp. NPDC048291 TaxID=3365530 RepID=UPI003715FA1E
METAHRQRSMHLAVFAQGLGAAHSVWRSPRTAPDRLHTLRHWADIARIAEEGRLDAVFIADALVLPDSIGADVGERPDPVSVLSALSAVTSRIGLIGTSSTTYNDPFTVARQFATLDHLSEGRAGWNIVTTAIAGASGNYGSAELPEHEARYARGEEFVEVVLKLWDSWEPGAIVADRAAGVYADRDRIHEIGHRGGHFQVRGPLTVPRPPQGRPLLAQAGSSATGLDLAARFADMVFTTQYDPQAAQALVRNVRALAEVKGRSPFDVKILPGLTPVIGRTESEARELADELGSLISPEATLAFMRQAFGGIDLGRYDLDEPFPDLRDELPAHAGKSRPALLIGTALEEKLTIRQMIERVGLSIGHRCLVGTPDQVADDMAHWFETHAADGFNIIPADLPHGLRDFVEQVVPRLQDRGLFRKEYTGTTLREHLSG